MRKLVRLFLVMASVVGLASGLVRPVFADGVVGDGTPTSCTEAALDTALALGGNITFACGGPATIIFSTQKTMSADTLIDGGGQITLSGANATRLFSVLSGVTLTLHNIILTNASALDNGGAITNSGTLIIDQSTIQKSATDINHSGGAIMNFGSLTITNSEIANNSAANAGAIFAHAGQVLIVNSRLHDNVTNSTTDGWGGAILLWAGTTIEIQGSELFNNRALQGGAIHNRFADSSITLDSGTNVHDNSATIGGGIYNLSGTATLTNITLQNHSATIAGGLYNESGTTTLTNVTLQANRATEGGGISNHSGTLTLTNVALQGNSATEGAGIYNSSGTVTVTNSTFQGNLGSAGAGLSNYSGPATLTNVTFQGNAARNGSGGGIDNVFGTLTLLYVTLQGNSATMGGGGIENNVSGSSGHLQLQNVVIADSPSGGNCAGTAPDSAIYSLSSDNTCTLTGIGTLTSTPALLGPLQDNGGGLLTLLPQPKSRLIDAGLCTASTPTDERGVARPQGAACDIGAVEVQPSDRKQFVYVPLLMR